MVTAIYESTAPAALLNGSYPGTEADAAEAVITRTELVDAIGQNPDAEQAADWLPELQKLVDATQKL